MALGNLNPTAEAVLPLKSGAQASARTLTIAALAFGAFSFGIILLFHNIADGDLWAKLALGAAIWNDAGLPDHDLFAFTPVLPVYVDHEWGAGLVFFTLLKFCGPTALMLLKMLLAFSALLIALAVARRNECHWLTLLALLPAAALCLLPGYVPVIRSHAFTYVFFSVTLLLLEMMRGGQRWPAVALPIVMMLWVNVHGGFVAGLGTVCVYAIAAIAQRQFSKTIVTAFAACCLATCANPWGPKYWTYVLPAILHHRADIVEWQPMPLLGIDAFVGFRILFVLAVCAVFFGRRAGCRSWPGLAMLGITAFLALRSRRHAPFFAVTALAFVGPFLESAWRGMAQRLRLVVVRGQGHRIAFAGYAVLAFWVSTRWMPGASLQVLAPVSQFPVREADILARSGLAGNLAAPFQWGSYASWRLYPRIKVAIDGRYEAIYPETTYELSRDFFEKHGPAWDRLLKTHEVDFVALDLQGARLKPEDLHERGYVTVWREEGVSALLVARKHADRVRRIVADLPPTTVDPLDAHIPDGWPRGARP